MSLLDLFRPRRQTAQTAKDRLQILLSHERAAGSAGDFLPALQRDLLEVIRRYVAIDDERIAVKLEREGDVAMLEVNIELPRGR